MEADKTQLIGTAEYPMDAELADLAETCPACQATIAPGEQFCQRCGYQRGTWAVAAKAAAAPQAAAPYYLAGAGGVRYALALGETVLGRGEVDVPIADGYLSRRHARFTVGAAGVTVTDLGSANGSFIGERRLNPDEAVELGIGTELKLGQTVLKLEQGVDPAAATPGPTAAEDATLVETEPAGLEPLGTLEPMGGLEAAAIEIVPATSPWQLERGGKPEFFIPYGETVMGRKPEKATMIVLGDGYISGAHLKLIASETTLEAEDLGSTNGSFVNSEQLEPGVVRQLGAGDHLRLGQTELTVGYNEIGEARSEVE